MDLGFLKILEWIWCEHEMKASSEHVNLVSFEIVKWICWEHKLNEFLKQTQNNNLAGGCWGGWVGGLVLGWLDVWMGAKPV